MGRRWGNQTNMVTPSADPVGDVVVMGMMGECGLSVHDDFNSRRWSTKKASFHQPRGLGQQSGGQVSGSAV